MRQSVQRGGEIYLGWPRSAITSLAARRDHERGRRRRRGDLHESFTDKQGVHRVKNDFTSGRYKVIADVTEATTTRRDKTVKSMLATAQIAMEANDQELAQAAIITAVMNQDGEGVGSDPEICPQAPGRDGRGRAERGRAGADGAGAAAARSVRRRLPPLRPR
jgi:hypothetical protein